MEATAESERLTEQEPEQEQTEPQRSAWELIDEEWEGRQHAPLCM